jgi:hypothetical protein
MNSEIKKIVKEELSGENTKACMQPRLTCLKEKFNKEKQERKYYHRR